MQVALNCDGTMCVNVGDQSCKSGRLIRRSQIMDLSPRTGLMGRCLALSPDGTRVAVAGPLSPYPYHEVLYMTRGSGERLCTLHGHKEAIHAVDWDRAGKRLVTAGRDQTIRVWDAANGASWEYCRAIVVTPSMPASRPTAAT